MRVAHDRDFHKGHNKRGRHGKHGRRRRHRLKPRRKREERKDRTLYYFAGTLFGLLVCAGLIVGAYAMFKHFQKNSPDKPSRSSETSQAGSDVNRRPTSSSKAGQKHRQVVTLAMDLNLILTVKQVRLPVPREQVRVVDR